MLSDVLDGYVARKRNEETEFGKIIDPVADKIFYISFAIFCSSLRNYLKPHQNCENVLIKARLPR